MVPRFANAVTNNIALNQIASAKTLGAKKGSRHAPEGCLTRVAKIQNGRRHLVGFPAVITCSKALNL